MLVSLDYINFQLEILNCSSAVFLAYLHCTEAEGIEDNQNNKASGNAVQCRHKPSSS